MRISNILPRPLRLPLLLAACLPYCLGCGGPEKLVSVSGKVTRNGEPVDGLVVSFVPVAQTITGTSTGQTDEAGQYALTVAKSKNSGAVVGTHKVWVSLPREEPPPFQKEGAKEERQKTRKQKKKNFANQQPTEMAAILEKYGNLEKSPLTVEVTGDGPIDLKLD
jgi:hypothetical protein